MYQSIPEPQAPCAPRASGRRKQVKLRSLTVTQIDCCLCWCSRRNSLQLEHGDYLHHFSSNNFTAIWDTVGRGLPALRTTPRALTSHSANGAQ